jgi:hypothetical protein
MNHLPALAILPFLAATLSACGSDRGEDELMRRVAQAEAAATKAEAAAARAEAAAAKVGAGNSSQEAVASPPAEEAADDKPAVDPDYGKGVEPVPLEG